MKILQVSFVKRVVCVAMTTTIASAALAAEDVPVTLPGGVSPQIRESVIRSATTIRNEQQAVQEVVSILTQAGAFRLAIESDNAMRSRYYQCGSQASQWGGMLAEMVATVRIAATPPFGSDKVTANWKSVAAQCDPKTVQQLGSMLAWLDKTLEPVRQERVTIAAREMEEQRVAKRAKEEATERQKRDDLISKQKEIDRQATVKAERDAAIADQARMESVARKNAKPISKEIKAEAAASIEKAQKALAEMRCPPHVADHFRNVVQQNITEALKSFREGQAAESGMFPDNAFRVHYPAAKSVADNARTLPASLCR